MYQTNLKKDHKSNTNEYKAYYQKKLVPPEKNNVKINESKTINATGRVKQM